MTLRVAVVHYHLRPAGVQRVVARSAEGMDSRGVKTCVLCGEEPGGKERPICPVGIDPALLYHTTPDEFPPQKVAERLRLQAKDLLGGEPDLFHIHNHALGKNAIVPLVARHLAAEGVPLLLHIHDFAEDGRPANYRFLREHLAEGLEETLYPDAPHVHYGFLNQRDFAVLHDAGIPGDRLHLLSNPVSGMPEPDPPPQDDQLYLYLTTGIRRKNVGEMLLLAALANGSERFALTRSPTNPQEKPRYERWVWFAKEAKLPVQFEFGSRFEDFASVLSAASACVTTSIAEGFGLGFLEPWLIGRPLYGRDLPSITRDFKEAGVQFHGVYEDLRVPVSARTAEGVEKAVREKFAAALKDYAREPHTDLVDAAVQAALPETGVAEFGRLDEAHQEQVISQMLQDESARRELRARTLDTWKAPGELVSANADLIRRHYNAEAYAERLHATYDAVAGSDASSSPSAADAAKVLDAFLSPQNFALLRSG